MISFSYRLNCFSHTHCAVEASQKIRLQSSGTHWTHPQPFFNSKFASAPEICAMSFLCSCSKSTHTWGLKPHTFIFLYTSGGQKSENNCRAASAASGGLGQTPFPCPSRLLHGTCARGLMVHLQSSTVASLLLSDLWSSLHCLFLTLILLPPS